MKDAAKTKRQLINELHELRKSAVDGQSSVEQFRQLKASEERYRVLLDESTDPVFSFSPDGRYLYANRAFAQGVGKDIDQIIGRNIWDVFSREEAEKRFAALSHVFQSGEEKVIEIRVPRSDGDRFYITTITPIKDEQGKVLSAICSSKEITDRKRTEEALRQSEGKYSAIFRLSPMNVSLSTLVDGRYVEANDLWFQTAEYTRDEVIGHTSTELNIWANPEDRRRIAGG